MSKTVRTNDDGILVSVLRKDNTNLYNTKSAWSYLLLLISFHKKYFILEKAKRTVCMQYIPNMANEVMSQGTLSYYANFPMPVNLNIRIRWHVVRLYLEAYFQQSHITSTIYLICSAICLPMKFHSIFAFLHNEQTVVLNLT